jgi:hypothetical protein
MWRDLEPLQMRPGNFVNFTFDAASPKNMLQPYTLLEWINQVSNSNQPNASLPTCDNAQDNFTEFACDPNVYRYKNSVPRDGIGLPTCISMISNTFD